MSGDTMKLDLDFDIEVHGEKKLEKTDQIIARITANVEKLAALGKAAESAMASLTNPGKGPSKGGAGSTADTRNATRALRDQLGIDRDLVRNLKMKIRYREAEASQAIKAAQAEQRQAQRSFREKFTFNSRLAAQRLREENAALRAVRTEQRATERAFKQRMSFATRMASQRAREEASAEREVQRGIRETGRIRAREASRAAALQREQGRERSSAYSSVGQGLGRARSGAARIAGVGAAAAAAGTYAAQRAVDGLTRAGMTIDEAMTASMIHIFGEQDTAKARKSAEALRQKLMPVASKLGTKTADLIGAYVEAAQAGIPDALLAPAVEYGAKYAKMNKLSSSEVLEQSGYAIQALKSFGAVGEAEIKGYYDEVSFLIATTSANRKELLAATKVGMSSGATVGMDRQQTLSVLGLATAYGAEGSQAARLLSNQGARASGWRNKYRDILGKHHRSADDRQFLDAVSLLGYRDGDDMANAFSRDFFGSLVNVQEKLKGISDPLKRKSVTKQLFGQEFSALVDSMIMGGQLQEFRDKLRGASGYLSKSWGKFITGFEFIMDKIGVVMSNLTQSMGEALKPVWNEVSSWVDRFHGFGKMGETVTNFTNGFLKGLGFNSVTDLLNRVIGDPAKFQFYGSTVFQAAKGFGEGVASIASGIRSLASAVTGGSSDPETLGRLVGQITALGVALTILSPVILVLGALTSMVTGLATAGAGLARLLGGGAIASGGGAAGAAASAGAMGAAVLSKAGQLIALGFIAEVAQYFNVLKMDPNKGIVGNLLEELVPAPIRRWLDGKAQTPGQEGSWQDPGESKRLKGMADELKKNTAATLKNTEATKDEARKATETKAAQIKAEEQRRLSELVSIRNGPMSGSIGGGSSMADQLRSQGYRVIGENQSPTGAGGGGSGVTDPRMSGDVAARAKIAHDFFRSKGLSEEATAGILASMKKESNFTPNARGDGGRAHGLFQHHADRRAQILAGTGIDMSTASFEKQLEGAWWEMNHGDRGAQRALRILKTPGISARDAGGAFVQNFERPKRDERAERGALAEGFHRQYNGGGSGAAGGGSGPVLSQMQELRRSGQVINEQCVSLAKAAVNASGSVMNWRKGVGAQAGTLQPGTPVATFLNRDGSQSDRYAGGGTGTMGAGTDHAGVFQSYVRDKDGKIIGMNIAEQYRGSDGVKSKTYMFGQGFGEKNGSNYHAVMGSDGQYLGGSRNPMASSGAPAAPPAQPGVLSVPTPPNRPRDITSGVPQGSGRRNNGAGGGPINIQIGAVHGGTAEANGQEIGKQVRKQLNTHYGDVDGWVG